MLLGIAASLHRLLSALACCGPRRFSVGLGRCPTAIGRRRCFDGWSVVLLSNDTACHFSTPTMRSHFLLCISLWSIHFRCLYSFVSIRYQAGAWRRAIAPAFSTRLEPEEAAFGGSPPPPPSPSSASPLQAILRRYDYDRRLVTVQARDLPLVAELYENGRSVLVSLEALVPGPGEGAAAPEPRAAVRGFSPGEDRERTVSFSEITTIWEKDGETSELPAKLPSFLGKVQTQAEALTASKQVEKALDRLYASRVGTSRDPTKGITKKQVVKIVQECFQGIPEGPTQPEQQQQQRVEGILRQIVKAGVRSTRLMDSHRVEAFLFKNRNQTLIQRAVAAILLAADAHRSGRFKRFPCLVVGSDMVNGAVSEVTIWNGGWLITDQAVRAQTEAKQFTERYLTPQEPAAKSPSNSTKTKMQNATLSDERIIRRLECLALGEAFAPKELQTDVRDTLRAMNLPLTGKGAIEALVLTGRWTGKEDLSGLVPWSKEVLNATACFAGWRGDCTKAVALSCGREDLTAFPCICIDSKRTSFRDDAIGIRPRSLTGRPVLPQVSKWELLIHIVDVSDIYVDLPQDTSFSLDRRRTKEIQDSLLRLRTAAQSRVLSRYDLPRPLHLMPPRVLGTLAFDADRDFHCCVTLWAYIDERDGRVVDAGLERSIVGIPRVLSFDEVSTLMEDPQTEASPLTEDSKIRSALHVIERNLGRWSETNKQSNERARKREGRLVQKEIQSRSLVSNELNKFEEERGVFRRTRGHRLIDAALELHGTTLYSLMRERGVPIPMATGADVLRVGRLATAPLRRYIDGQAQRQALAALCSYGEPLTRDECNKAGRITNDARNAVSNVRARKY